MKSSMLKQFFLLALSLGSGICSSSSKISEIRRNVLKDYNPAALPFPNAVVAISMILKSFDFNEATEMVDVSMLARMVWRDYRLAWNPSLYPNISSVHFHPKEIWLPDFVPMSGLNQYHTSEIPGTLLTVSNDSQVEWSIPIRDSMRCIMNWKYWPYDSHSCKLKFGSWDRNGDQLDAQIGAISQTHLSRDPMSEWKLIEFSSKRNVLSYVCCPESYIDIIYLIKAERKTTTYHWIVTLPCFVLQVVSLMVFLIPPQSEAKVHFSSGVFISNLIFLNYLWRLFGNFESDPPLMIKMVSMECIITSLQLFLSICVLHLTSPPNRKISGRLRTILKKLSPCLLLGSFKQQVKDTKNSEGSEQDQAYSECLLLGAVLDRVFLLLFCVVQAVFLKLFFVL